MRVTQDQEHEIKAEIAYTAELIGSTKLSEKTVDFLYQDLLNGGFDDYQVMKKALLRMRDTYNGKLTKQKLVEFYNAAKQDFQAALPPRLGETTYQESEQEFQARVEESNRKWQVIVLIREIKEFRDLWRQSLHFDAQGNPHSPNGFLANARAILTANPELKAKCVAFLKEHNEKAPFEFARI